MMDLETFGGPRRRRGEELMVVRASFLYSRVGEITNQSISRVCGPGVIVQTTTQMQLHKITRTSVATFALLLGSSLVGPIDAQSTAPPKKPDNTAVNKRDQNPGEATADQQKMNEADRD